jgi:hypothetical protein
MRQNRKEITAIIRSYEYLLQCVKKLYYFKNSSKPCSSSDLRYVINS